MKDSLLSAAVVEPYADALMALADARDLADRFGEDARTLLAALEASEDLRQLIANPTIAIDSKKRVLRTLASDRLDPLFANFLMLLADKNRLFFLDDICRQYLTLLRRRNQTVLAEVTAAIELAGSQRDTIRDRVKNITGARDVELEVKVDPDLLGGAIVRVGSQVLDASLRGQLRRLSLQLAS
ncbi:ATP synthase, F1 delta subunit [Rubidibacter lacunae KORDI 51-2]|uniref:ATP synthase subunit delta n=1 Tax=Rubidibacter lacunae KORDI 51-2 TaxID=582515 RepID=U5DBB1_9CHRO|nr:ATP synthase F1 subunit delta [Rubidibacter lacunae]ERN41828.1 ATP synthase, F1 delta subunit [Rubidibacter lacunae KORDI 51-2]